MKKQYNENEVEELVLQRDVMIGGKRVEKGKPVSVSGNTKSYLLATGRGIRKEDEKKTVSK